MSITEAPQDHVPVMLAEILEQARPVFDENGAAKLKYLDGTLGRGGHLERILGMDPRVIGWGCDRDPQALEAVSARLQSLVGAGRLHVAHRNFMVDPLREEFGEFDLVLLDLGVSSPQLDRAERGFSFYHEGPLDMRMDPTKGFTAADILAEYSEEDLNYLFREYGEIRSPYRVTRAIVHDRKTTPFTTTRQLAGLIERVQGWAKKGFHPATPFFLALRLKVNAEIDELERGLKAMIEALAPGGRLLVITFHSLEDRIAKNVLRDSELGEPVFKKVIVPTDEEIARNPRARSAKLRVFQKHRPSS